MKKNLILFGLMILTNFMNAQNKNLNFGENQDFKIVQFTDVHYEYGNKASSVYLDLVKEVLDEEKPDLVVFTGDIVWKKSIKKGFDEVLAPVIEKGIPWACVFGNHDDEADMSRQEIMDYLVQKPFCMSEAGDQSVEGIGNYVLEIKDKDGKKIKALLYFMDSGAYTPIKGLGKYNWFDYSQIDWYRDQSKAYTESNNKKPYPALAFFHIPLAEYPLMSADTTTIIGTKSEDECNGKLNTGMFAAMRTAGDVMGTFVGHDHNNDYIGNYYGIYLAYGRYSGGKTVYNDLGKNGCRIIELKKGEKSFDTYIRLLGGEKLHPVNYPNTFK